MAVKKKSLSNLPEKHKRTKDEVRHPYLKGKSRKRPRDGRKTEVVEICDGEAKVFRTLPSGDVWQFEMNIKHERYEVGGRSHEIVEYIGNRTFLNEINTNESQKNI